MKATEKSFKFFVPLEFEKAKDKEGNEVMKIAGIASTNDKDSQNEILEPSGFDLKKFLSKGLINWHHQTKNNPEAIIGEPTKAYIKDNKMYLEAVLYSDSEMAQKVYKTAQTLEKSSGTRRLGFSIEGKPVERDPFNKSRITKAEITGCAITYAPINGKTLASIVKGELEDEDYEYGIEKGEDIVSLTFEGNSYRIDNDFNLVIEKAETTESLQAEGVVSEDLEGSKKKKIIDLNLPENCEAVSTIIKASGDGLISLTELEDIFGKVEFI